MKKFVFKSNDNIPTKYIEDIIALRRFIWRNLDIETTNLDIYKFWCEVSKEFESAWLNINLPGMDDRAEFLLNRLEKYGIVYDV